MPCTPHNSALNPATLAAGPSPQPASQLESEEGDTYLPSQGGREKEKKQKSPVWSQAHRVPPNPCSLPSLCFLAQVILWIPWTREKPGSVLQPALPPQPWPLCAPGPSSQGLVTLGQPLSEHCPRGLRDGHWLPCLAPPSLPGLAICSWVSGGGRCTTAAWEPYLAQGLRAAPPGGPSRITAQLSQEELGPL